MADGRTRIAVLGGGVGAITAAFEITESPGWEKKYEITLYQLGWRLGGKGASGRNRDLGDRIEEHGLHMWFGYYENSFNAMRRCYEALGRPPQAPLSTCIGGDNPAFRPHELFVICQFQNARWSQWKLSPPVIGHEEPGDGTIPPLWEVLDRLLAFLHRHYLEHAPEPVRLAMEAHGLADHVHAWLARLGLAQGSSPGGAHELVAARAALAKAGTVAGADSALEGWLKQELHEAVDAIGGFLERLTGALESHFAEKVETLLGIEPTVHRLLSLIDLGYYMLKGIIADDVLEKGFDQLDHLDLREWLASHGAGSISLDSDALRVAYESIFAYEQGSYQLPNLAAGTGLRGLLRLCFTFKGGFAWKMQAGMGDTIFAPYYEVLRRRGVKFRFFNRVKDIVPSADGTRIDRIVIGRQATVLAGPDRYDPLYEVNGLPCWPATPDYDQLAEGAALRKGNYNLESFWTGWQDVGEDTLEYGHDFDEVVMGISLGAVPCVAPRLMQQKPAWQTMVDKVRTVQTQAFQIWTRHNTAQMRKPPGGEAPKLSEPPVYGGFAQPHNTCADMSHLLPRENWGPDDPPQGIFYLCGPMIDPSLEPLSSDTGYPAEALASVKVRAAQWLRTNGQFLFPGAVSGGYPGGFPDTWDFDTLYQDRVAHPLQSELFDLQFWRANIDPCERYVLSVKGSTPYRIRPDDTGYDNLVCAGDWTRNGLNYGCVEGATMSGMAAARRICGYPQVIFGEHYPKP